MGLCNRPKDCPSFADFDSDDWLRSMFDIKDDANSTYKMIMANTAASTKR